MIRIEKLIPLFLIIIFLNNCGYTPRYGLNKNINFSINLLQLDGDREFNNSFKSKITRYKKKDANQNEFNLDITSKYNKNVKSKDAAGLAKEYELTITVNIIVKSESIDPKKIINLHSELKFLTKFLVVFKVLLIWFFFSSLFFILNFVEDARWIIISGLLISKYFFIFAAFFKLSFFLLGVNNL